MKLLIRQYICIHSKLGNYYEIKGPLHMPGTLSLRRGPPIAAGCVPRPHCMSVAENSGIISY